MDSRHADLLDRAAREGVKPGLDRIAPLTAGIEMPPVIHVAGTNGKGSTVVMLETILEEHGFSTGAYIQPHLIEPTERIRLRGRDITWDLLDDCLDALLPRIEGMADGPTYFEIFTAAAAIAFSMAGVDVAILETGMGGRLDATNHFPKEVACITRVALDHTAVLGGTVREIAREKAGIVASGVPVVTGASGEALGEIEAAARSAGSPLHVLGRDLLIAGSPGGFSVRFRGTHDGLRTAMDGRHQMENAALAVASAALLVGGLDTAATRRALARASLPGRFQVLARDGRTVVLDCAHNPDAAAALADTLERRGLVPDVTVFAAMGDKDLPGVLDRLPRALTLLTTVGEARSAGERALRDAAGALGLDHRWAGDPSTAFRRAIDLAPEGGVVLVTGSGYLVGAVLREIVGRPR